MRNLIDVTDTPDEEQPTRILVMGNSGSGKSTLAAHLASKHGLAHLDLDTVAWQPTTPPERTPLPEVQVTLDAFTAKEPRWVVEGCYADLLGLLASRATELVFLDLPVELCQQNARSRPFEPHKYPSKAAQDENLEMLLSWIAAYQDREGPLGRPAHVALFEGFTGRKLRHTARLILRER